LFAGQVVSMSKRKIVLFGGTFDPIHLGHVEVAAFAYEAIGAEKVIFVPAKRSPLKNFSPVAGDEQRMEMINLAIAGYENFEVRDFELNGPEPSYTIDTIRHFKEKLGDMDVYWLAGADNLDELSQWYKIDELLDECNLSLMFRAGCESPSFEKFADLWGQEQIDKLSQNIIETPLIDISSTEVRKRLAGGEDVSGMLCASVIDYIERKKLYR